MTLQDYESKITQLKDELEKNIKDLAIEYAKEHNPYSVGDIIKDHNCKIIIEKIIYTFDYNRVPCCAYVGTKLNKDNSMNKLGKKERVYQLNIE